MIEPLSTLHEIAWYEASSDNGSGPWCLLRQQIRLHHIEPYMHSLAVSECEEDECLDSNPLAVICKFTDELVQLLGDLCVVETTRHSDNIVVASIMLRHRGVL